MGKWHSEVLRYVYSYIVVFYSKESASVPYHLSCYAVAMMMRRGTSLR